MTPASDTRRPTLLTSALRVFDLSLGQMLWSRRSLFLALLLGGPLLLGALARFAVAVEPSALPRIDGQLIGGLNLFGMMVWLLYIRFIVPVLGVFYGTSLIADEVDDRTITYLFVRPIPRAAVLLGKYVAYLATTSLLVLPSLVLLYFLVVPIGGGGIGVGVPSLMADLATLLVGLAAYGALFAWIGARMKRPLVVGLVFAFGWEPGVLLFPGYLKRLTVAYYLQELVPHSMPGVSTIGTILQNLQEGPSLGASLAALTAMTVVSLWLATRAVEDREYVLEP